MKRIIALFAVLALSLPCFSQAPVQNLFAIGGAYNINGKPSVAGSILYAHYVAAPGTYAFTAVDFLPTTTKPFAVTSNIGAGMAQKMFSIGKVSLFMPTAAGFSWTGSNAGWQWTGGAALVIPLKHNFCLVPSARFLKSSVSGGSGYQPILNVSVGWEN